ncbi:MAG: DUF2281 domain-containing protein [Bacteroidota bacterium]
MSSSQLLQKISSLTEAVQSQLLDYIEFLLLKYQDEENSVIAEGELSDYGKKFLEKRLQDAEEGDSWQNVKQRLYRRKNWEEL